MRACSHGYIRRDHPLQFTSAPLPSLASNSLASAQRKPASRKTCTRPLTHTPPSSTYPRLSSGASNPYHLKRPAQPPPPKHQPLTTLHTAQPTNLFFKIAISSKERQKLDLRCSKLNTAIVKRTSGEKKKKRKTGRASASAPANAQHSLRTQNVPSKKPRCQKMGPGPHHPPK